MGERPANEAPHRLIDDVNFGSGVFVQAFTNLYGCEIGDETRIGPFVEIQRDARIGARCKIQSHTFVCSGVEMADEVFVGHGVMFINDRTPRATAGAADWELERTVVCRGVSIGSGATILCGIRIGERARVGAGAVVVRDVAPAETVSGVPARPHARHAD